MEKTRYDKDHAEHYDATRDLIPETRDVWANAVRKYLPSSGPLRIIDIGSGTGRFSEVFASSCPSRRVELGDDKLPAGVGFSVGHVLVPLILPRLDAPTIGHHAGQA